MQELPVLYEGVRGPFPYDDLRKMRKSERLALHFENLGDDDWLSADLNTYFIAVDGLASRLLEGNIEEASITTIRWLALGDFLAIFPRYRFLEGEWEQFSQFAHMYGSIQRMREIVLALSPTKNELQALQEHNPQKGWEHFLGPLTTIILDDEDDAL
ncbi:MAG TPA: YxiJ family protein [Ktedonobacteraceae bacterium]|nr:YxiJ family protein [Ktedonobacteraceae bacterium]